MSDIYRNEQLHNAKPEEKEVSRLIEFVVNKSKNCTHCCRRKKRKGFIQHKRLQHFVHNRQFSFSVLFNFASVAAEAASPKWLACEAAA
ncbi:MAG TPA: hypothetical protein VGV14_11730 [Rhodanobacter sp.]|nr:hypothetical protein [Rhodanobacter sp.]